MTTGINEDSALGIEMRVHGIGDHAIYSALGSPKFYGDQKDQVRIGEPPPLPEHKLRLVNWSRASRSINRSVVWYLAFPFTLMNVAGYMGSLKFYRAPLLRAGVALSGLCLTVSMAVWGSAIIETALAAFTRTEYNGIQEFAICAMSPLVLIATIAFRLWKGTPFSNRATPVAAIPNIIALVLVMAFLLWKPASQEWPFRFGAKPGRTIDPMLFLLTGTMLVVGTVALALAVVAVVSRLADALSTLAERLGIPELIVAILRRDRWKENCTGQVGAAYAGAALLTITSLVLLHTAGSIIRLATSTFVHIYHVYRGDGGGDPTDRIVLSPFAREGEAYWFDFLPAVSVLTVLFFTWCLVFCFRCSQYLAERQHSRSAPDYRLTNGEGRRYQAINRWHDLLSDLAAFLPVVVLISTGFTVVTWLVCLCRVWLGAPTSNQAWLLAIQLPCLALVVMVIFRWPEQLGIQLKRFFGRVADVAGFWSPDLVPLAGTSYRPVLIKKIREVIESNPRSQIALVGHSQGSVICAYFVAFRLWEQNHYRYDVEVAESLKSPPGPPSDRITLFTCGSPLNSLYATFFPSIFNRDFFDRARNMSYNGVWENYWRRTDPIATPIECHQHIPRHNLADNLDVTELEGQPTNGHGEYWKQQELIDSISTTFKQWYARQQMLCLHEAAGRLKKDSKTCIELAFKLAGERLWSYLRTSENWMRRFQRLASRR